MRRGEKEYVYENANHGDQGFPLSVYSLATPFQCHWHTETEIIYIEKGGGSFVINSDRMKASTGDIFFINSGDLHFCEFQQDSCSYHAVVFDLNILSGSSMDDCQRKYINPLLDKHCYLPNNIDITSPLSKKIGEKVLEISWLYEEKAFGWEITIKAQLMSILSDIIRNNKLILGNNDTSPGGNYKIERLKQILNYIAANYSKKITVEDLASSVNISTYHLHHFFREMTGKTPTEYINHFRMNKVIPLLKEGSKTILEASSEVGFENLSYFCKLFKSYNNCTAGEFRNRLK